ncbi:lipoprotein-releasing ABC transporter ATP-binding protein LolD [sulfur-oxidizing endosymbiont of Gigantopelta aegis]|uniref:lipoprotein-releasing ABC transporter ATP-binding protein LolD n=1 Tax=sulfur-oxidizing endosymbiont of Gigantopelta aegis TaxID=2794934 RepID=UPI0018DDCA41|nr:lipoprotein-releasing ABC transporter ATP-binding protein LolD [sulfur-oxidizing endosymbiont of Gigantopelta aegis]
MNKTANKEIIIDCQNITQYFDDGTSRVDIFKDINLQVTAGQRLAIVGASGSGKSTLLYMMGGLDKIKSGKLIIDGQDVSRLNPKKLGVLRNHTLGFVYQFHHLLHEFSALENVAMPLLIRGDSTAQAKEQAAYLLDQVGLSHRLKHKPGELSGGERQRAAIARALVTNPKCLLADEPTGNLDNHTAKQVYDLLIKLNEEMNISLVLVTHDEKLASRMDSVLMLADGNLSTLAL